MTNWMLGRGLIVGIISVMVLAGCGSKQSASNVIAPIPTVQSTIEAPASSPHQPHPHTRSVENVEVGATTQPIADNQSKSTVEPRVKETPSSKELPSVDPTPATSNQAPTPAPTLAPTPKPKPTPRVVRIPVLNYHSIGEEPNNNAVLSPKNLAEQMNYLAKNGYTTLSLRQFIDIWQGRMEAPPKPILLTFDDGYADNYQYAMPILKEHQFKAVLFMSPGSVGDGWYIDWEQAKEMHEAGWDIQPHGMTHPYLNKLSLQAQKEEIEESARLIEEKLGIKAEVFCYPYGVYNKDTLKILTDNHYKLAFTIDQGFAESTQNPLTLKRLFIGGRDSLDTFITKITKG